jgi:hypothetical protein
MTRTTSSRTGSPSTVIARRPPTIVPERMTAKAAADISAPRRR